MKCAQCSTSADGYAVIPGVGDAGEIRFFCDRDARAQKVKLRYWDGRDLDIGGWRDTPDLGKSFYTLIFTFQDLGRMRPADLQSVLQWVEDRELATALSGADTRLLQKVYRALSPERAREVRELQDSPEAAGGSPQAAQEAIIDIVRKL
jgi:hypothetical protein